MLSTLLVVLLILILLGALPLGPWPGYSGWPGGYTVPGLIFVILLILLLVGRA